MVLILLDSNRSGIKPGAVQLVTRTVTKQGVIAITRTRYHLGKEYAGHAVHVLFDAKTVEIFDSHGTQLALYPRSSQDGGYIGTISQLSTMS